MSAVGLLKAPFWLLVLEKAEYERRWIAKSAVMNASSFGGSSEGASFECSKRC